ncbi:MAG: hypothetical protein CME34_19545 [Gordonia sp.]|nr:hypothetical protein [Gordonia sp. (in: high G+C Gram-positive bacteria)]
MQNRCGFGHRLGVKCLIAMKPNDNVQGCRGEFLVQFSGEPFGFRFSEGVARDSEISSHTCRAVYQGEPWRNRQHHRGSIEETPPARRTYVADHGIFDSSPLRSGLPLP